MTGSTFGQYFPGNSLLHKMDARMKIVLLILLMVSIFLCNNYASLGLVILITLVLVFVSKISFRVVLKSLKPILIIVVFTTVLNAFYGSGEVLLQLGRIKITEGGVNNAVFMAMRIILLVIQGVMLTYTTTPTSLTDAMEALMKPLSLFKVDTHSIAMTMTIALRFIPTLSEEVDRIISAQKSRGADIEGGGIVSRAKAIVPIIIPLFISAFGRAYELAEAMECRCYRGGEGRTKMKVMHLQARDYISMVFVIAYLTGIILLRIFMSKVV